MNQKEAWEQSREPHPGSRSLRCVWYCGLINGKIRQAARLGEKELRLVFPPKHYVVQHRQLFCALYENQGFRAAFTPNFFYIQPTEWTFTIDWNEDSLGP